MKSYLHSRTPFKIFVKLFINVLMYGLVINIHQQNCPQLYNYTKLEVMPNFYGLGFTLIREKDQKLLIKL